jgi:hypothetical protein
MLSLGLWLLAGCTGESGGGQKEQSEQGDTFTTVAPRDVEAHIELGDEEPSVGDL